MSERSKIISKLRDSKESRAAYIKAKLSTLIPSQIRALRLKSNMPHQSDLAQAAGMKQSRISVMEMPGAVNFNLETLVRLASVLKVGLLVKFVSFSEMLNWENRFSQDDFTVTGLEDDADFLVPVVSIPDSNLVRIEQTGGIPKVDGIWTPVDDRSDTGEVPYNYHETLTTPVLVATIQ